jgi:hypothetical protein
MWRFKLLKNHICSDGNRTGLGGRVCRLRRREDFDSGALSDQIRIEAIDKLNRFGSAVKSLGARLRSPGGIQDVDPKFMNAWLTPGGGGGDQAIGQSNRHVNYSLELSRTTRVSTLAIAPKPPPMLAPRIRGPHTGKTPGGGQIKSWTERTTPPSNAPPPIWKRRRLRTVFSRKSRRSGS